jgi:hypothetical protein
MTRDTRGQTIAAEARGSASTAAHAELAGSSRLARAAARARRENGQAMVEFALVLPLLMLIDAVRAGARQLAIGRGQTQDVCSIAMNRVRSSSSNLDQSAFKSLDASVSAGSCDPGTNMVIGSDATVSATYPCDIEILPFIPQIPVDCKASTTERVE